MCHVRSCTPGSAHMFLHLLLPSIILPSLITASGNPLLPCSLAWHAAAREHPYMAGCNTGAPIHGRLQLGSSGSRRRIPMHQPSSPSLRTTTSLTTSLSARCAPATLPPYWARHRSARQPYSWPFVAFAVLQVWKGVGYRLLTSGAWHHLLGGSSTLARCVRHQCGLSQHG